MGALLYGTSSWSEKSWVGPFYPEGTAPGGYLAYYATPFPTVEADVTYYRVPDRPMVAGWDRKTPSDFVLSAKFPRSVVHGGEKAQPDTESLLVMERVGEETGRFLDAMRGLGRKCGPLLLQFPYFNRSAFRSADPFLERLDRFLAALPGEFRYAVEVRNADWIGKALLDVLRRHKTSLVLVDLAYMPHPADPFEQSDLLTADFAYARLIGDRKAVEEKTEVFDRIVIDQGPRLERWATLLKRIMDRVAKTYVYANNHYAGFGSGTIRDLAELVLGKAAR
ncbi:MAG: DUF72 domain-containing protein [Planctomycetota bacterium]